MLLMSKPIPSLKCVSLFLITLAFLPSLSAAQTNPARPPHAWWCMPRHLLNVQSGDLLTIGPS